VSFEGGVESIDIKVNIDRCMVTPSIYLFLLFKDMIAVESMLLSDTCLFFSSVLILPVLL
jgi:hypothetical protein